MTAAAAAAVPAGVASRLFLLQQASRALATGGVIAYPTESVWGLGCDPANQHAVARLITLKQRQAAKGLILIAASSAQLEPYIGRLTASEQHQLEQARSQPTSWVVPVASGVSPLLTGGRPTLCVRVSTYKLVRDLCHSYAGPVVSTSANPAGRPPARSAIKARRYFGRGVDYYLPGPVTKGQPSEIRDLRSGAIIRPGTRGPIEKPPYE